MPEPPADEPIADRWFRGKGWSPLAFQREAWDVYASGFSGLINAPTGMGKSFSALFGPLQEWVDEQPQGWNDGRAAGDAAPVQLLWVTPLRALANDLATGLAEPLLDLNLPWSIGARTGDTSAREKLTQRLKLPSLLITTPESLSILLSYPETQRQLAGLRAVVVDEWHELLGNKRGVQTELGLARLRRLAPRLRTWGLSATIGNLDEARGVLLGSGAADGRQVRDTSPKSIEVETLFPDTLERFPWSGHLGLKMLPEVILAIDGARTSLVFTNVRSQAEIWYRQLLQARPDWEGCIALHHGSIDSETRRAAEEGLRAGTLRCVVCTSSLDLGVDFSPVDQVIQIGSPRGVARLVQRAGRSGHCPGQTSRVFCVPTNALELIEFSSSRRAIAAGTMEERTPLHRPLDLLAQHLVTIALGAGFDERELFDEVRTTHAYRDLDRTAWAWVLEFVVSGGATLSRYARYGRLRLLDGLYQVASAEIARTHRMTVGTITDEGALDVQFGNGKKIGRIEESFLAMLRPGDCFVFAGKLLELVRVREMTATVRVAKGKSGRVPSWQGGRMSLSSQLATEIRKNLQRAGEGRFEDPEMEAVRPLLALQARRSVLPKPDELLIESLVLEEGTSAFLFPFAGRLAHEGLGAIVAFRLIRSRPESITVTANDYGIELRSTESMDLSESRWRELLQPEGLLDDLLDCLNTGELARRQFREIARVAGLVAQGFPGRKKSSRQLQASSGLLYDMFSRYDPEHLLLDQAHREVLDRQLEFTRLQTSLDRIQGMRIRLQRPVALTPLAFPLWAESLQAQHLTSERRSDRVRRMVAELEEQAGP